LIPLSDDAKAVPNFETSCYLREIEKQIHQAPEYYFGHTDDGNID
jgi:KDO2-lipid IV(A) lauroyltransferase